MADTNVAPLHAAQAEAALPAAGFQPLLVTVRAGETAKSLRSVGAWFDRLAAAWLERRSVASGWVTPPMRSALAAVKLRGC
jgi:3-dehydroquinate synthetase